jgi:hypothetical protein
MKDSFDSRKGQASRVKRTSGYLMDHYQEEPPEPVMNIEAPPRWAVLDLWSQHSWDNGTQIDELDEMQRIHVRTVYSLYEITVIDGRRGEILIKGGEHIPDLTEGRLTGATLGGSFCKIRGIYPGFKMEFVANGQRLITSTVQTVSVFHPESLQESQ